MKIPVIVIVTPFSDRSLPLINTLQRSSHFQLLKLKATMGKDLKASNEATQLEEFRRYGRVLLPNERGCAVSHYQARLVIAKSKLGGVIFEDDARINNLSELESVTHEFLTQYENEKSILSLLDYSYGIKARPRKIKNVNNKFIPLFAESPLAVATVQTKLAALELTKSSKIFSQTSDWPLSKCKYYILKNPIVNHGDENTISTIGNFDKRVDRINVIGSIVDYRNLVLKLKRKLDYLKIMSAQKK